MIRSIIIEDDPYYSKQLEELINKTGDFIEVVASKNNIEDALIAIKAKKPDLLFLDIVFGGNKKAGFELLKKIKEINFDVIFTTAHVNANIEEIRMFGLDYIAKPYVLNELKDAIEKFKEKRREKIGFDQINSFRDNLLEENVHEKRIWIRSTRPKIEYTQVKIGNIIYCESSNQYTVVYYLDEDSNEQKDCLSNHGLIDWESYFKKINFFRIHQKYLVNLSYIRKVSGDVEEVILSTGKTLEVSRRKKSRLLELMNPFNK